LAENKNFFFPLFYGNLDIYKDLGCIISIYMTSPVTLSTIASLKELQNEISVQNAKIKELINSVDRLVELFDQFLDGIDENDDDYDPNDSQSV